jgi:hypothetical protein
VLIVARAVWAPAARRLVGWSAVPRRVLGVGLAILRAQPCEGARREVEALVVVRQERRLLGLEAGLVVVTHDDPGDDVAAGGGVERTGGDAIELLFAAVGGADGLASP